MAAIPLIVADGRRPFDDVRERTDLRLAGVEPYARGAMMVTYAVAH